MIVIKPHCIGCGHCVPYCPTGSITVHGMAKIHQETCKECGMCITYCPNFMIMEVPG